METLLNPGALQTVRVVFLAIVLLRVGVTLARLLIILQRKMLPEIRRFADDFLQWRALSRSWLGLSLSISSWIGYFFIYWLSARTTDLSLAEAFALRPSALLIVGAGLLGLAAYAVYRSWDQIRDTIRICDQLKTFRLYHHYKDGVEKLQRSEWMEATVAGQAASLGLSLLTAATDSVVRSAVSHHAGQTAAFFALLLGIESAGRILLVFLAVYAATGDPFFVWS